MVLGSVQDAGVVLLLVVCVLLLLELIFQSFYSFLFLNDNLETRLVVKMTRIRIQTPTRSIFNSLMLQSGVIFGV